ncbi:hypothetical protein [Roseateles saccharophilus]|uniref:Molybdopterin-dependent oxidoreductase iron-sulfur protein n=1 Tax=Roseateles saccharophilus TaxID=304 RepID=A0A4R3VB32_ROSSA|nr:hypothetical protein [Roseateles saccharophilus]MDG0831731.1 hypothetical protein [Roseateles saccharophilus]TCV01251.1 molybdopterin-dependent oxidoreductase iron-sulfur protein [Roseateles saccharophilus]
MPTSHYRICPLCEACCGLEVKTEGARVVAIRGAENDAFSHGYLCPKGVSLKDLHEDPDRLRMPLTGALLCTMQASQTLMLVFQTGALRRASMYRSRRCRVASERAPRPWMTAMAGAAVTERRA